MNPIRLQKSLSIIIPAYNEAARILPTIERTARYAANRFTAFEIIVVDDGSSDATAELVRGVQRTIPALKLLRFPANKGKGAAVRAGVLAASSELLLLCDADLSAPIEELDVLLPWLDKGFAVVIGSRALKESRIRVRQPFYRETMGKTFGVMARFAVVPGIRDLQCGFKLFGRDTGRKIFERCLIDRFAFDVEVLYLANKMGLPVREVAIDWSNSRDSRVRLVADSLRMMIDLYRIRINALTRKYGRL